MLAILAAAEQTLDAAKCCQVSDKFLLEDFTAGGNPKAASLEEKVLGYSRAQDTTLPNISRDPFKAFGFINNLDPSEDNQSLVFKCCTWKLEDFSKIMQNG